MVKASKSYTFSNRYGKVLKSRFGMHPFARSALESINAGGFTTVQDGESAYDSSPFFIPLAQGFITAIDKVLEGGVVSAANEQQTLRLLFDGMRDALLAINRALAEHGASIEISEYGESVSHRQHIRRCYEGERRVLHHAMAEISSAWAKLNHTL